MLIINYPQVYPTKFSRLANLRAKQVFKKVNPNIYSFIYEQK